MFNLDSYFDATVQSISDLVKTDSSQTDALPGMPFGEGPAKSLHEFLALAESFGFETNNYDNYIGEAIYGEGEEFAILCHLDVVPAGNGWTYPAFGGEIHDGKLYGRGTSDDKGAAVICLYCLKALKDNGFVPKKKVKLIVGCNEESGWECIAHYKKVAHMPDNGFTPDADFPVIYAEKGIFQFTMNFPVKNAPFTSMEGGERANMVCEFVRADNAKRDDAFANECGIVFEEGAAIARGVSAHASTPEQGVNALEKMLRYFSKDNKDIQKAYSVLFDDCFGLRKLHDETGFLTLSPNVVTFDGTTLAITSDIRYPATMKESDIRAILDKAEVPYEAQHCQDPLFNDRNGFLISTLQKVYEEQTGDTTPPIAIGGGTYARALKNGAAFGLQFPGEPSTIHQKNEYISLKNVRLLLDIYCEAIYQLTK